MISLPVVTGPHASDVIKSTGVFKSARELSKLSGVSLQTLTNWRTERPALFYTLLLGAVAYRTEQCACVWFAEEVASTPSTATVTGQAITHTLDIGSISDMADLLGEHRSKLKRWFHDKPVLFRLLARGCHARLNTQTTRALFADTL